VAVDFPIQAGHPAAMVASGQTASPLISAEQIAQFHRDGYCVVDALFSPAETDAIEAFFEDYNASACRSMTTATVQGRRPDEGATPRDAPAPLQRAREGLGATPARDRRSAASARLRPAARADHVLFQATGREGAGITRIISTCSPSPTPASPPGPPSMPPRSTTAASTSSRLKSQKHPLPGRGCRHDINNFSNCHIKPFPKDAKAKQFVTVFWVYLVQLRIAPQNPKTPGN